MRYIFVDFEMNPYFRHINGVNKICGYEIIEIGAIMLDEQFNEIDTYKQYVKPKYSRIHKKYEKLTGISTAMVACQDGFKAAFKKFVKWCGALDYKIYAWSDNDKAQLIQEIELKKYQKDVEVEYMLNHWIDFQDIFRQKMNAKQVMSLDRALKTYSIQFVGRRHDALDDAINTSLLYVESNGKDLVNCIEFISKYRNITQDLWTLGETLKFNALNAYLA